jgi:hypothetical protein
MRKLSISKFKMIMKYAVLMLSSYLLFVPRQVLQLYRTS